MAADWNQPTLTTQYATLLAALLARDVDAATMFQATGTPTNIPDKAVRWNPATNTFEQYSASGSTWSALMANGLSVPSVTVANAPTVAGHATRKDYVDAQVALAWNLANAALPKAGGTMTGELVINAGASSNIAMSPGGVVRYIMGWDGANWIVNRYSATGVYTDTPLYISTSSGQVIMNQRPYWGGVTPWDTGNLPSPASLGGGTFTGAISSSVAGYGKYVVNSNGDNGGAWVDWNASNARTYALQITAPSPTAAYGGIRWTQWGSRHLAAIDAYAGGSTSSAPFIAMHVDGQNLAWQFGRTDITRGAGGTVYGTWNLNPSNYAPVRHAGYAGYGYVITDIANTITMNWDQSANTNLYIDGGFQGAIVHSNNLLPWLAGNTGANGVGSYALTNTANLTFGNNYSGASVGLASGTWTCMNGYQSQGGYYFYLMFRRS